MNRRADGKVYLDYNATTPLAPEVLDSITDALQSAWGNPSSSHHAGQAAKDVIDKSRQHVASMIGAISDDIVFTSGGTEADNMIISSAVQIFNNQVKKDNISANDSHGINGSGDSKGRQLPHIISSHMEHPAVNEFLKHLENTGQAEVTYAELSHVTGCLETDAVLKAVRPNTVLVTVMLANNETGITQPVKEICDSIRQLPRQPWETQRIFIHTDAAQAIGKIPINVSNLGVDYLTIVGHKFYGPRIGAVFAKGLQEGCTPLFPVFFGGGQERALRPGTENTGMMAGLGKASELVCLNLGRYKTHMQEVRDYLEDRLQTTFPGRVHFNGKSSGSERLPNTCNFSIQGHKLQGHSVLSECQVLQASVGAACHAQNRPSAILLAIGVPVDVARNALRLSVGRETSKADIDDVIEDLKQAIHKVDNS